MSRDINNFEKATDSLELVPGSIWRLPVSYSRDFPHPFIFDNDDGESYNIQEGFNEYWCENGKYKRGMSEEKVVSIAGIHPFLLLQKPNVFLNLKKLRAIGWHKDFLMGILISSFSNITKEKTDIDPDRIKGINDYPFYHYLKANIITKLDNDSYVTLCVVSMVHKNYFTEKIGHLTDDDYIAISTKFRMVFF